MNTSDLDTLLDSFEKQRTPSNSKAQKLSEAIYDARDEPYTVESNLLTMLKIHCQTCHKDEETVVDIREVRRIKSGSKITIQLNSITPKVKITRRTEATQQVVLCSDCYKKEMERRA